MKTENIRPLMYLRPCKISMKSECLIWLIYLATEQEKYWVEQTHPC